jgi:hypothetical protein
VETRQKTASEVPHSLAAEGAPPFLSYGNDSP